MLFGPHGEVVGGQRGLVREGGQVLVGLGDVGPGDRGAVGGDGRGRGGVLEVGEGGLFAYVGLLGGGAQGVALLAVGGVLGDDRLRQSGDRVDDRGRLVGAGHGERGEQEPARGGGLLDGPVEVGEGVRSGARAGRGALGELLGGAVQLVDRAGVRLVCLEGAALAGERGPADGRDAREIASQGAGASVRSSSSCRSTRALRLSESPCPLGRPAAMKAVTSSRSSAREWESVTVCWVRAARSTSSCESLTCPDAVMRAGAAEPAIAAATTATAMMSRLRTRAVRRPPGSAGVPAGACAAVPAGTVVRPSSASEAACLPLRRGRIFRTGARIPDSSTHGPG